MVLETKSENLLTESLLTGGKPKASDMPVVKAFNNGEFDTLDLSVGNIEKAYEAFRQEQLEKLAYDNLAEAFEARFKRSFNKRECYRKSKL